MIVHIRPSIAAGAPAGILLYPGRAVFQATLPSGFEALPAHRLLLAVAPDGALRSAIQIAVSASEEIRVVLGRMGDEAYREFSVDSDAFAIATGAMPIDQAEAKLLAVYESCPGHSQEGDFLAMVRKFAEDAFYKLHLVALEYLAAIDQPAPTARSL